MEDQMVIEALTTGAALALALGSIDIVKSVIGRRNGNQPVDFAKVAGENGVMLRQILTDQKASLAELRLQTTALGGLNLTFVTLATKIDERTRKGD